MKEYNSIFNHALAPITPGPSSSNTCGPVRIGLVCRDLLGEIPAKAVVEYYSKGAFVGTLYGMKSDVAFINGLLGREQNNPEFNDAYHQAELCGMDVSFKEVDDLTIGGMETVRVRMTDHNGNMMSVIGESLGGGAIKIHAIDNCEMAISGLNYELVIFVKNDVAGQMDTLTKEYAAMTGKVNDSCWTAGKDYAIVDIKSGQALEPQLMEKLMAREEVFKVRVIHPVHPIVMDVSRELPFTSPDAFVAYCEEKNCTAARAAIDYEMAASGWNEKEVRQYADMLLDIMRASRESGFNPDLTFDGIVTAKGAVMKNNIEKGKMPSLGILNAAIPASVGIMEHSNATGKIVCVPTGGSSGIVPALLLAVAENMQLTEDELYEGLMAAGIIGVLMMVDGNEFAGGTHGCQAEIACGTAMAAAGMVQLMGGTAKQACDAASMSLQSFLGLICDPVAGLVQVPCLARNIAGVTVAAASAESVCAGFDPVIPLDEMSRIMVRVGGQITSVVGMCCSGCCMTPTGQKLTAQVEAARKAKAKK